MMYRAMRDSRVRAELGAGVMRVARAVIEPLEGRTLLTVTLDPISATTVPGGKSVFVPVHATTDGTSAVGFTTSSSNSQIQAQVMQNLTFVQMDVAINGVAQTPLVFALFGDIAPNTVSRFVTLVQSGFYDNLTFHRIIPGFMAQGGDPLGTGSGGSGTNIDDEYNANAIFSATGLLAMANSNKKVTSDTNDSQFFITAVQTRWLDFHHTIFGQLVSGYGAFSNIMAAGSSTVRITSAKVIQDFADTVLMVTGPAGATSTITVTAADGSSAQTTAFGVTGVNDSANVDVPFLNRVPASVTTFAGATAHLDLSATNIDNQQLIFIANRMDDLNNLYYLSGNTVTLAPSNSQTGSYWIQVGVFQNVDPDDGTYKFDTQWISLTVLPTAFATYTTDTRTLSVSGTSGDDTISLSVVGSYLRVTENGAIADFALSDIDNISIAGGDGNDTITVGTGVPAVAVSGDAGNDSLVGGAGNDTLHGGVGDDTLVGGAGSNTLDGGDGTNVYPGQPTDILLSASTLTQNAPSGAAVGQLAAVSGDPNQSLTYALVAGDGDDDNDAFVLDGATLRTAGPLDYQSQPTYRIRVRVTTDGMVLEKALTVTFNHAPTGISLDNSTVAEQQAIGTKVGTFSAADPDAGNTFTYSLVAGTGDTNNGLFTIDAAGNLRTAATFDFESGQSYSIRVQASDQGSLSVQKVFIITVTNVNEVPTIQSLSPATALAGWPVGTVIGTLSATDPDTGDAAAGFTWSLVSGTGSTNNAVFSIVGNQLITKRAIVYSGTHTYSIRVRVTDAHGAFSEKALKLTVTGTNVAPTNIRLSNANIAENKAVGTTVGTLSATDANAGDTFTYSLPVSSLAPDNAAFTISGSTLKTNASFNYEKKKTYTIRVQVKDKGKLSFTKSLTINVTNVNETPTSVAISSRTVAENKPAGTVVGTLSTKDPDANQTFTYTLVKGNDPLLSADNAKFKIVRTAAGVQLQTNAKLNYEANPSHTYKVVIRATDQGKLFRETPLTINVTNVNEAPTAIAVRPASVAEHSAVGTVVGTLSTTDPDAGNRFTYRLVSGTGSTDNAAFKVLGSQLTTTRVFNYEARKSYAIRVRSTDQSGLFCEKAITISIGNVNESPSGLTLSAASVVTGTPADAAVATLLGKDPDAGDALSYQLIDGIGATDNARFKIVDNQLLAAETLMYTSTQNYQIRVRVTDAGGLTYDKALVLGVTTA